MMCSDRIVTLALDLPLTGNSYERCMYVWVVYISQVQFTYVCVKQGDGQTERIRAHRLQGCRHRGESDHRA